VHRFDPAEGAVAVSGVSIGAGEQQVTRQGRERAASLKQIWNVASVVLAGAAGLLFAAGYTIPGLIAFALCAGSYAYVRRSRGKS
jgi:Mn2+/Fe2+ NRAMP family transporter